MTLEHMGRIMCVFFHRTLVPLPTITYTNLFPVSVPIHTLWASARIQHTIGYYGPDEGANVVTRALNNYYYGKVG